MGNSRWNANDWDSYASSNKNKSRQEIFNAASMKAAMNPAKIKMRESRDSAANPNSTPIILALDVTGSMGMIAESLAREGLGTLVEEILARKPVSDPHIMAMGVGDSFYDAAPLQVTQFEADISIAKQLKDIYLEGGGGGNNVESYTLPWYFAATKTDIDCVKHGKKGILFTFGDEECPDILKKEHIKKYLGENVPADISTQDLLKMVQAKFDVFHVIIEEGNYARSHGADKVRKSWEKVLPADRIISVKDYKKLPQILVSAMEVYAGKDPAAVAATWQGKTGDIVADAIKNVKPASQILSIHDKLKKMKPATPALKPKAA